MTNTNTATITRLYEEHENNNNNNNNINNSYYYYLDTDPGVSEKKADFCHEEAIRMLHESRDEVIECYQDALGIPLNNIVAETMVEFIEQGHYVWQLIACIRQTAFAPKPSPAYLRTVMNNYDSYIHRPNCKPKTLIF